jgi:hypothetical protein
MDDLYGDLDEDLKKWFGRKGAPGKKKGWVDCNTCRKDKKTGRKKCSACGRSDGEKRSKYPACRPTPSACGKRGKWGKKSKKKSKKNEELYMDLEQMIKEELKQMNEGIGLGIMGASLVAAALSGDESSPEEVVKNTMSDERKREIAAKLVQKMKDNQDFKKLAQQWEEEENLKRNKPATNLGWKPNALGEIVKEELEAVLDEKRKKKKKKKKKKAKRDACYHKVKSRYKVWPSAYASGALVKCRKVGAKNWGNSKKESLQIMVEDEIAQVLHEKEEKYKKHDMYNPKTGEKHVASVEKDHNDMAERGFVHVDPKKIEQILRDEGGAAGMDPFLKEFGEEMKDEIVKALDNMPNVAQHEDGDYILDDDKEVNISEKKNCGCGQDPCKTYGKSNVTVIKVGSNSNEELGEKKKKKKACKPSKGKRFAKRVNGKCRSFGQKGQAKGGGDRIRPGTKKGDAYCARSAKIKKCKNPPCANALSRKKWKCRGSKSMKE